MFCHANQQFKSLIECSTENCYPLSYLNNEQYNRFFFLKRNNTFLFVCLFNYRVSRSSSTTTSPWIKYLLIPRTPVPVKEANTDKDTCNGILLVLTGRSVWIHPLILHNSFEDVKDAWCPSSREEFSKSTKHPHVEVEACHLYHTASQLVRCTLTPGCLVPTSRTSQVIL